MHLLQFHNASLRKDVRCQGWVRLGPPVETGGYKMLDAAVVDVSKEHLDEVLLTFLRTEGKTETEVIHTLQDYQEKFS